MVRSISVLEKETSKRIHASRGLWKINTLKSREGKWGGVEMGRKTWGLEHPRRNYLKNNYLPENFPVWRAHKERGSLCLDPQSLVQGCLLVSK